VTLAYQGGDRGWKGDVPVVRSATERIRARGWNNRSSSREALRASIESMLDDARAGRLW
jgi:UDP-glucose 4-epimerase